MPPKQDFVDLVDFFERWPNERRRMLATAEDDRLSRDEQATLRAMIFIIDCVGPNDLAPASNPNGIYRIANGMA